MLKLICYKFSISFNSTSYNLMILIDILINSDNAIMF